MITITYDSLWTTTRTIMRASAVRQIITLFAVLTTSLVAIAGGGGAPDKPTDSASKVRITFTADPNPANLIPIRLLEGIEIWPAEDESKITHYNVYWGDSERNKLGIALAPRLAHIPATKDGSVLVHEFPPGLKMEAGAIWVLVCAENDGREFCGKDGNMEKVTDPLLSIFGRLNTIKSTIKNNGDLAGVEVMKTCSNLICDGVETAQNCPSDCSDFGHASFNFQVLCNEADMQDVYHPTSIAEIQAIIKQAAANGIRVKVTGGQAVNTTSGSATSVICTDGITLVMDQFDHEREGLGMQLETFEGQEVVSVAAGTNMHELGEWLYSRGKGLGYVHLGWRHVSVAGAIGTSAHGSSPKNRNILSHSVVSMDVIGADGEIQTYSRGTTGVADPDLWKAFTTHLGYMGVITRVRLEVQAATNTQVKVTFHNEDELFENNKTGSVYNDIKDCDYGQYNWFPSQNQYLRTCGKTTTAAAEDGANNRLLFPYVDLGQLSVEQTMQIFQIGGADTSLEAHENMAYMRRSGWHLTPPLVKTVKGETRYTTNAIAPTHRITSSKLIDTVGREMRQMDWEVAVPFNNMQAAMEYVRDFTNGMNVKNRSTPVPLIGIFVRFSKVENNTLLAYTGTGNGFEDGTIAVHIEMPIFVPAALSEQQFNEYMDPYEEAMRVLVTQYGARGHWGKNMHSDDPWMFELQRDIGAYGDRLTRFNNAVAKVDPNGMFANKFAKAIGIKYPNFTYPASW
ncbi:L-gulono-1,4-lactone dehydrogenase [BD1-7 clade bacterium]|uniref:L-gulono-1,4-lactone dehydrogenase n=1 Tax=BD1-7 clade bacterium TaxID=2029982 RepID=A0A5S9QLG6_9GAMM|nr:L-gulono-1,4-lactone dehydrogenase [BD1-7 clade bacterium]